MRPTRRAILLAAPALLLLPGAARAQRTVFERLAFATPKAAVDSFLLAWRGQDFPTVFWILAPETQRAVITAVEMFQLTRVTGRLPDPARLRTLTEEGLPALPAREHDMETAWLFDRLMVTGHRLGAVPLALPPDATAGAVRMQPDGRALVTAGPVEFVLQRSPAGHWRVQGAFGPGADRAILPWGIRG